LKSMLEIVAKEEKPWTRVPTQSLTRRCSVGGGRGCNFMF